MTPHIDPGALRAQLAALPDEAKAAVIALFQANEWPPLAEPDAWDADRLFDANARMKLAAEKAGFVNWVTPLDTATILERIKKLPRDLADLANDNAKDAGLAKNPRKPETWTIEDWELADTAVMHAEGLAAKRLRHLHACVTTLAEVHVLDDQSIDDYRHRLASTVSHGRTESGRELTGPEVDYIATAAEASAAGVGFEVAAFVPDWKAQAKALGTTQAALLAEIKAFCEARTLPKPTRLSDVVNDESGYRMIAHVLLRADDGETIMSRTAAAVEEMAETPAPAPEPQATLALEPEPATEETPWPAALDKVVVEQLATAETERAHFISQNDSDHALVLARLEALERTNVIKLKMLESILAAIQLGAEALRDGRLGVTEPTS